MKKRLKLLIQKIKSILFMLVLKLTNGEKYYYLQGKRYLDNEQYEKAKSFFKLGQRSYPKNSTFNLELAKLARKEKNWKESACYFENYIKQEKQTAIPKAYIDLSENYRKLGSFEKMEQVLVNGLDQYPDNRKIFSKYVNISIMKKEWNTAIKRMHSYISNFKDVFPYKAEIRLSMLYKIIGDEENFKSQFNSALNRNHNLLERDKKDYCKIIVFDNGETRIEYYKRFTRTNQLIITYDSINMVWSNQPFAFKLLSRMNVDIIAIRKRKKQTYQQDLTQKDFIETVKPIVQGYEDVVSYGFSLGAYLALYFGSLLNTRILSISPRLSIHPVYGRKKMIGKYEFKHNISFSHNEDISPIVVYDPRNNLDNRYVNEHILNSFPKAVLVEVPYGGHGMAPHLLKMGLLKDFVNVVIKNEGIPKYDKSRRNKSNIYFRSIARECLRRNKPNWAYSLVEKSLELLPTDKLTIKLKIDILKELKEYDKAIDYARNTVKMVPQELDIRIYLIDLYIYMGELSFAEDEIEKTLEGFGERKSLLKRIKKINEIK